MISIVAKVFGVLLTTLIVIVIDITNDQDKFGLFSQLQASVTVILSIFTCGLGTYVFKNTHSKSSVAIPYPVYLIALFIASSYIYFKYGFLLSFICAFLILYQFSSIIIVNMLKALVNYKSLNIYEMGLRHQSILLTIALYFTLVISTDLRIALVCAAFLMLTAVMKYKLIQQVSKINRPILVKGSPHIYFKQNGVRYFGALLFQIFSWIDVIILDAPDEARRLILIVQLFTFISLARYNQEIRNLITNDGVNKKAVLKIFFENTVINVMLLLTIVTVFWSSVSMRVVFFDYYEHVLSAFFVGTLLMIFQIKFNLSNIIRPSISLFLVSTAIIIKVVLIYISEGNAKYLHLIWVFSILSSLGCTWLIEKYSRV